MRSLINFLPKINNVNISECFFINILNLFGEGDIRTYKYIKTRINDETKI